MKFVYLLFIYEPKHKYGGYIYEGHYRPIPFVFEKYAYALKHKRSYKITGYICKVKLR